jgi:hypothetical protein
MDSWFFYTTIYLKTLGHVLPNCFFGENNFRKFNRLPSEHSWQKVGTTATLII